MVEAETSSSYGEARLHFWQSGSQWQKAATSLSRRSTELLRLSSHLDPLPLNLRIKSSPFILYSHPSQSLPWSHLAPFLPLPTRRRKRPVLGPYRSAACPACVRLLIDVTLSSIRSNFDPSHLHASSLPYTIEDTRLSISGPRHPSILSKNNCSLRLHNY